MEDHLPHGGDGPLSDTPSTVIADQGRDTRLCRLDALADPGSKAFLVGEREAFFVVRRGDAVYGYVNICPHRGTPLDWKPDTFLSLDLEHVQCATHGARFLIETGECVLGPCYRLYLEPVALRLEHGTVMLDE